MQKVFVSFHHANDQDYKDELVRLGELHGIFEDMSVDTFDVDDDLPTERIRQIIRDEYLRESNVTIVLVGVETKRRKHVDWETKSSMIDGTRNKKSGILVVNLPSTGCTYFTTGHAGLGEKEKLYPRVTGWTSISTRKEYENRYPYMPDRIIDNLLKPEARISVVNWDKIIESPDNLRFLVEATAADVSSCEYDLSRPMRQHNS